MANTARGRVIALALFATWLGVVLFAARNHAVWRDEVRALSVALHGDNAVAMLRGIHGEGHPALWYLLLRGGHALVARPEILQIVALIVASAAVLLLLLRSPFSWPLLALFLAGNLFLFEYSVMARNYGISMLLLFLLAAFYERHRDRGPLLGILLLLLANCSAHSVLLVGAFLLFWLVDITTGDSTHRPGTLRVFMFNAAIATLGVAICILTIFPVHDALVIEKPHSGALTLFFKAVVLPAARFPVSVRGLPKSAMEYLSIWKDPYILIVDLLMSLVMFGSTLGLVRRPAAFVSALAALVGMSLFFAFVYRAEYRHEALWLAFLICCYWIAGAKARQPEPEPPTLLKTLVRTVSRVGWAMFLLLFAIQVPIGIFNISAAVGSDPPFSRSRDLGSLVAGRPDLKDATIIADPDNLVESLPYYLPNRTYLIREQRFGKTVIFTQKARLRISLNDILVTACGLRSKLGKPVVILMAQRLDPSAPPQRFREAYNWDLTTTPEQVRTFLASTRLIKRFAPAITDESFDVYLLN
jgi:hypothetical protein